MATNERLQNELERIERRLAREKQNEEKKSEELKQARLRKAYSRLDFLKGQTPESIQRSIIAAENKQLLLQDQIAKLQEWVRLYHDLLNTRDEQIAEVKREIDRLEGNAPAAEATVESVQEQWAFLQGLLR